MTNTIPDHVGREAVRLLNDEAGEGNFIWPMDHDEAAIITVAKLLMDPPAPMTDPDEEAAKRVLNAVDDITEWFPRSIARATEQMRREREAWEAGR